jgi:hypothetical protein
MDFQYLLESSWFGAGSRVCGTAHRRFVYRFLIIVNLNGSRANPLAKVWKRVHILHAGFGGVVVERRPISFKTREGYLLWKKIVKKVSRVQMKSWAE